VNTDDKNIRLSVDLTQAIDLLDQSVNANDVYEDYQWRKTLKSIAAGYLHLSLREDTRADSFRNYITQSLIDVGVPHMRTHELNDRMHACITNSLLACLHPIELQQIRSLAYVGDCTYNERVVVSVTYADAKTGLLSRG
jgi:hypothetical protein